MLRQQISRIGLTGISMGGHMASLAACNWPEPVPLTPCLSWTTASSTYTRGALSGSIPWNVLQEQFLRDNVYQDELMQYIYSPEDNSGGDMSRASMYSTNYGSDKNPNNIGYISELQKLYEINMELDIHPTQIVNSSTDCLHTAHSESVATQTDMFSFMKELSRERINSQTVHNGTFDFMRKIMDECTHLANYSKPLDTSLITIPTARHDLYYPRENLISLSDLWPGSEIRYLDTDHVGGCLFHHSHFRAAIIDSFDKYFEKYPFTKEYSKDEIDDSYPSS